MTLITRRAALLALAPVVFALAIIAHGTPPAAVAEPGRSPSPALTGTYALPDGQPKIAATLTATPKPGGQAGAQVLDVAMTCLGTGQAVTRYETELSKQLHLIAVSGDPRTFVHEHGEKPDARGHFRVVMAFARGPVARLCRCGAGRAEPAGHAVRPGPGRGRDARHAAGARTPADRAGRHGRALRRALRHSRRAGRAGSGCMSCATASRRRT